MSMTTFESSIRQIQFPQQKVYDMLSNLENIERVKNRIPEDKIKDLTFDNDSISISVLQQGIEKIADVLQAINYE